MKYSIHLLRSLAGVLPLLMTAQVHAAGAFDPFEQPLGSIAPLTLTTTDLASGAMAYRGWFENGGWQGDLIEYTVSSTGGLTTSVDLTEASPTNPGSPPANWSAHVQFAAAETTSSTYWTNSRKVITYNGSAQKAFRWDNLSDPHKTALDAAAASADADTSLILDFVRGDRSHETPNGGYRRRYTVLGDIIHSNPVYVGPPDDSFTVDGYAAWASGTGRVDRDARVYVGANDGMLHAFDADTGDEAWAYVPSMLVDNLDMLAGRPYSHRYGVDGNLTAQDVRFPGDSAGVWRTMLVGGLGAGGKGWFGLDITDPSITSESATSGSDIKVMWELDAASDADLGYSYGQAVIAKLNDQKWYAIVGNGYVSTNGVAMLYIIDIDDGGVRKLSTSSGTALSPNGLSAPTLVDVNRDGTADIVYAGDIDGQLWKFDLSDTSADAWAVAYSGTPLHSGTSAQPIIQPPEVTLHPGLGHIVYFGTGRLFTEPEIATTTTQSLYGIWDRGTTPPTEANQSLLAQTLSGDLTYTATDIEETVQTFNPDAGSVDWSNTHGWKVDLPAGFRALTPPQLRGGRIKVTVTQPSTRSNYLVEAFYLDGGSPGSAIFDLDQSGVLNNADNIDANADDDLGDPEDVVVMWEQPVGVMSQTTIARVSDGVDTQLLNYVVPPAAPPCSGDCVGGFQGGHIDVDTDYPANKDGGVGEKTEKHTHQYDKETERVYVDYFDHGPAGKVDGQVEMTDTGFMDDLDDEWIVVVANADLSPGSVLVLGDREYNVVEYQAMIHEKLRSWNGSALLKDDDNQNLIFTTQDILDDGGTVRHKFNDMAILAGGLHPSDTKCVNKSDAVTNDRYRNGALVTQVIKRSIFTNCSGTGCSLDKLIVQDPDDLINPVILGDGTQVDLEVDYNDQDGIEYSNYEIIGGLRANISGQNDDDALFESTLFWHYGGKKICYGDDGWAEDVQAVLDELIYTQEEFEQLLEDEGVTDLASDLITYESCSGNENSIDNSCEAYYNILEWLQSKQDEITNLDPDAVDTGTGLDSDGETPVAMEGAASETGVTAGPNFDAGRRTWTDVTDD
jgi:outer membrane protein assembly factor BamB